MAVDDYNPGSSLAAYFPSRDERRIARLWAREKMLHDLADLGAVDFFEGGGSDPTVLPGYAADKLWLRVDPGVTDAPGTVRYYGGGDATLLASWPELDRVGFSTHALPTAAAVTAAAAASAAAAAASAADAELAADDVAAAILNLPDMVSSPVQQIASGSSFSYRMGTAFSVLDLATYGSWVFDGTDGYPNKLGVTGTKPVAEPSWGARTNDTYVAGSADVAAIIAGYDNVNNALAGLIASQHSMLAAGADHASIWGGSLHTILDDTDYSVIVGGVNHLIQGRGRMAAIIAGDACTIETGASDDASGFRSVILGSTECVAGGRNGSIVASSGCNIQSTYGVVLSGELVSLVNGAHMIAMGNTITMGDLAPATYSIAIGYNIAVNGARATAFGDNHTIASGHDYSSARGSGGVTPFAGAHVSASRHRGGVAGRNQAVDFQCSQETTDTTTTRLSCSGSSGYPIQPENSIVNGIALVTGVSDAGVCSCFEINFISERVGSGTPTLRQNATTVKYDGLALPTDPTMNATSGGVYRVQVVGLAATNIRWNARIVAEQIVYA